MQYGIKKFRRELSFVIRGYYKMFTATSDASEPAFILIGVRKGGTASFFSNLVHHPNVRRSARKEVHFFDRDYQKGMKWYRTHFPPRSELDAGANGVKSITGEATPSYIFHPPVPARIAQNLPDVKLILLLRNPVARAYSAFQMKNRKSVVTKTTPEQALGEELRILQKYSMNRETYERLYRENRSRTPSGSEQYPHHDYLLRGLYYEQLSIWFEHIPRERFLIIKSEDYFADPHRFIEQVAPAFLGLPEWKLPEYEEKNQNISYPKIDPALRDQLAEYYKPHNEKLNKLLGVDYGW